MGETIFVPSNWYHQVWNLNDTISINHNWFNGCNILKIWYALENHLQQVIKEIDDCKDMPMFNEHCQIMLKASFGMDYEMFLNLLCFIVEKRLKSIENNDFIINGFTYGKNHILFDINSILNVLNTILKSCDFKKILIDDAKLLIIKIQKFLQTK